MSAKYTPTIGVEIHCQLNTRSKMFCACDNDSRGAAPNTNVCPICLGFPGTLPTINRGAVERAILLGLGLNAQITEQTKFDRKNYFYPDLSKGYQITQFDQPIVHDGTVEITVDGASKSVGIERAHLEEDAAKLIHPPGQDHSLVDYNRGGTPLLEIVSKPDMHSPAEARAYLQRVYAITMALGVTDGNMEEGNFKFDLNVSISPDPKKLGVKVELKNLNSFRFAEKALHYEIKRQTDILAGGGEIAQETRGYNDARGTTFSQRSKEDTHDYRYFPEPDLPPLVITESMISPQRAIVSQTDLAGEMPKNALDKAKMAIAQIVGEQADKATATIVNNWLDNDVAASQALQKLLDDNKPDMVIITAAAQNLAALAAASRDGKISSQKARQLAPSFVVAQDRRADITTHAAGEISDDTELEKIIRQVIAANPQAKADFAAGKDRAVAFLVGQVMAQTRGQANPGKVNSLMRKLLKQP